MDWDLPITLDGTPDGPLFVRVASAISREVRSGRLARGQRLPGSRRLSQALGIHRNTVLAAFEELAAEG